MAELPDKVWVRRGEARAYLGLSESAFTKLVRAGGLKARRFPGMTRAYFSSADVRRLVGAMAEDPHRSKAAMAGRGIGKEQIEYGKW